MKINIGEKEYKIKFGYKPTLKERIISKSAKMGKVADKDGNVNLEKIEDLLLYLPELLLVGLQVHHEDFRYDYDTKEGKDEQLEKATALVSEYLEADGADAMDLFNELQEALTQDSFLASLFRAEQKKAETIKEDVQNLEDAVKNPEKAETNPENEEN